MASEQEHMVTKEAPAAAVTHEPSPVIASEQGHHTLGKEAAAAPAHKPSVMEQVKDKVTGIKDKLTGHEHAGATTTHTEPVSVHTETQSTQSPKAHSPKGESFLQKIKDKLPGAHPHEHATPATTATTTPGPAAATTGAEPAQHHEGIGEKISHFFKGGHSDVKSGEQKEEAHPHGHTTTAHEEKVHGVTGHDSLKD